MSNLNDVKAKDAERAKIAEARVRLEQSRAATAA